MAMHILQCHNVKVDRCSMDCICNALMKGCRASLYIQKEKILQLGFITISLVYSYF